MGLAFDSGGKLCGDYFQQGFLLSYGAVLQSALGDAGNDLLLLSLSKTNGVYSSVLVGNRLFAAVYGADAKVFVFVLPTP